MTLLAGELAGDAWFGFADGRLFSSPAGLGDPIEAVMALVDPRDAEVFKRAIAVFGLPWAEITHKIVAAMMRTLAQAPPWWAEEFMHWEPDELRALRGNVTGGQESFVRAMRAIRTYRLSTDDMPPLRPV